MRTVFSFALGAATGAAAARLLDRRRRKDVDDATLADRVRSAIFRASDAPQGSVSVDVQAGVAYLRGEVADQDWIDRLGLQTRDVRGINGVENLLQAHRTAEPGFVASEHPTG